LSQSPGVSLRRITDIGILVFWPVSTWALPWMALRTSGMMAPVKAP